MTRQLHFKNGWKKATATQKKRLLRGVIRELRPTMEGLEIYYRLQPTGSEEIFSDGTARRGSSPVVGVGAPERT